MILSAFTFVHVAISLVAIAAGFVVLFGLIARKNLDGWTKLFLSTTVATSVTGYFFPVHKLLPSHIVGAISLIVLFFAIRARYKHQLAGAWRKTYVWTSVTALYLNFFVLIVQSFEKVPALKALAPTQSEPPFVVAQVLAMLLFIVLGAMAAIKFQAEPLRAAASSLSR